MAKPVIGVLPLIDTEKEKGSYWMLADYIEGIKEAGGLPVIFTFTDDKEDAKKFVDMCDGILFTGGHDVDPLIYGEDKLPECAEISPERDVLEKLVLEEALKADKAVLGICRGLQFINAYLGGTLYQDLRTYHPSEVRHRQKPPYSEPIHEVILEKGSPLFELLGTEKMNVNSCHHQAVKDVAPCLKVMAEASDGIVESAYYPDKKFLWLTQWHPEFMHKIDLNSKKIFKAFVEAAKY